MIGKHINYPKDRVIIIEDPPCALAGRIRFVKGVCPYSLQDACNKCIANEFDRRCVECLRDTPPEQFGSA